MEWFINNKIITYCLTALGYIPACIIGLSIESYSILALFIILDVGTGITRSLVTSGGRSVTSSRLSLGLLKKGHMFVVPWLVTLAGHGMGVDLLLGAKVILGGLIASELYSILGNIYSIYTGEDKPEFDGVKFILKTTLGGFKDFIKSMFKK
jgi:hypothetical protein